MKEEPQNENHAGKKIASEFYRPAGALLVGYPCFRRVWTLFRHFVPPWGWKAKLSWKGGEAGGKGPSFWS